MLRGVRTDENDARGSKPEAWQADEEEREDPTKRADAMRWQKKWLSRWRDDVRRDVGRADLQDHSGPDMRNPEERPKIVSSWMR
jgi:hypothetical protein